MKEVYSISEVSEIIGMSLNTVRLYETYGYISYVERNESKYRMYENKHIEQLRLVQIAFSSRVVNKRIMSKLKDILIESGKEDYGSAEEECVICKLYIEEEQERVNYAIEESYKLLSEADKKDEATIVNKRKEAARKLGISMDALRNWERNGLITIKKDKYGCNCYTDQSIFVLRAIKLLRSVDFSMMSIIKMRDKCREGGDIREFKKVLDSATEEEGVYDTDQLISLLEKTKKIIPDMICQLHRMNLLSNGTPPEKMMIK